MDATSVDSGPHMPGWLSFIILSVAAISHYLMEIRWDHWYNVAFKIFTLISIICLCIIHGKKATEIIINVFIKIKTYFNAK